MVVIDFPDGVARRLHERWRDNLAVAQARYTADKNETNGTEYLKVLRTFTGLVLRNELPDESADG
jgi:hypothetical protein